MQQLIMFEPLVAPAAQPLRAKSIVHSWLEARLIRPLDLALAEFCLAHDPEHPEVALVAAIVSRYVADGHICFNLAELKQSLAGELPADSAVRLPAQLWAQHAVADWQASLPRSRLVTAQPEQQAAPLVLQGERLYLYRYWRYEAQVAQALRWRLTDSVVQPVDMAKQLQRLFPGSAEVGTDWQKVACAMAASGLFTLITGGPGTGKTTTVVRLLALLQEQALTDRQQPLHIRLAAPTGKAAARLTESIRWQVDGLSTRPEVQASIPTQVSTLHRLLGSLPDTRAFRHNARNPLALDVLVVDEASMIDLEMMDNLLQAMPSHARLIILGDKDQLASVEAGSVLGELCLYAEQGRYTEDTLQALASLCGEPIGTEGLLPGRQGEDVLEQRTVMLRHSRRFAGDSGIGQLARAVNAMDAKQVLTLLQAQLADVHYQRLSVGRPEGLHALIRQGYAAYLSCLQAAPQADMASDLYQQWALKLLSAFEQFRILCAVREGPYGVQGLNQQAEHCLASVLQKHAQSPWYAGRPVMVTRNDYGLGLMNGDIGITVRQTYSQDEDSLRVVFARLDGQQGVRLVLPSRLTAVETVFAMTVHKSQGSEFEHAAMVLPDAINPVLTKELLYTGITRARSQFSLLAANEAVIRKTVEQRIKRNSGLRDGLNAPSTPVAQG